MPGGGAIQSMESIGCMEDRSMEHRTLNIEHRTEEKSIT